jgi:hypothetical protein
MPRITCLGFLIFTVLSGIAVATPIIGPIQLRSGSFTVGNGSSTAAAPFLFVATRDENSFVTLSGGADEIAYVSPCGPCWGRAVSPTVSALAPVAT